MTQRNPMNDRYQSDTPKGQTKRSASSLKPKTKAASSVYIRSNEKTPQEKKAIRKEQRQKQRELDSRYYNPPTEEYKKLRRMWWVFLIAAIILTALAMIIPNMFPDYTSLTWVFLIPAYICIFIALWLDSSKIRKVRQAYQQKMLKKHSKEAKKDNIAHTSAAQADQDKEQDEAPKNKSGIGAKIKGAFGAKKEESQTEMNSAEVAHVQDNAQLVDDSHKSIARLKAEHKAAKAAKQVAQDSQAKE